METPLVIDHPPVAIPVQRFLLTETCPPEWQRYDLYLFRDAQAVFYVGQSRLAFVRVWEHIIQGFKGRSVVGRFILANWPVSMKFMVELMSSKSSRFAPAGNEVSAAERYLIDTMTPCFNEALNGSPAPVPAQYRAYNAALRCSRSLNHLMREAGYAVKAEEKKLWLAEQEDY